uniref:ER-bound oxygenase mpaB/mpaB'/Rubber oxygenase catalytic domain-containing protein n=1 Tax=Homalodisca liturata TaxID=320908 RepID=A0A1B6IMX5_9HEMI
MCTVLKMDKDAVVDMDKITNGDASGKKAKLGEVGKWIIEDGENVPLDVKQAFLLPAWYDEKKFKRGQKYFADNYFSLFVAKLCGLLVVLAVPSILRVLVLTGQSSHPVSAFRRYLDTISHMLEWYEGDVMNPNSRASKSLLNIRSRHCHATRRATKAGFSNISQRDMALTQFGFMGFAVLRPKELGLTGSQEDLEGFLHFWRVIGHLLGIKEQYNLCQGDVETTRAACQAMLDRVFNVGLRQPSADFQHMSRALLEGMWALVPFINPEAFLSFTLLLCGIDTFQLSKFYSRTLFNLQVFIQAVILNSVIGFIVRPILNFNMWLSIFITQRFPYLAFLAFGRSITPPEQFTIKSSLVSEN